MAQCRDCEFDIVWADRDGKAVPFDERPLRRSADVLAQNKAYVLINGKAKRATQDDLRLHRDLHTCHFDTCTSKSR